MKIKSLLRYRYVWMAFAIFWGVFYHSNPYMHNEFLIWFKKLGYGCVDIFFFASGVGCFYSLSKDSDPLRFMKRRVAKILPAYWMILPLWFVFRSKIYGITFYQILANLLCIQEFTQLGNNFNWYISGMMLFYLLSPLFYHVLKSGNWFSTLSFTLLLVVFSLPFVDPHKLMFSRLPIFFIGMIAAKEQERTIDWKVIVPLVLIGAVALVGAGHLVDHRIGNMWDNGLFWYPFIIVTPGLCLVLSLLGVALDLIKVGKIMLKVIQLIGSYTFEWYLTHIVVFEYYHYRIVEGIVVESNKGWLLALLASIGFAVILALLVKGYRLIVKLIMKRFAVEKAVE